MSETGEKEGRRGSGFWTTVGVEALRDTACGVGGPLASSSGEVDRAGCLVFMEVGCGGGLIRRRLEARVMRGSFVPSIVQGIQ